MCLGVIFAMGGDGMMNRREFVTLATSAAVLGPVSDARQSWGQFSPGEVRPAGASTIPEGDLIQPEALNAMLHGAGGEKPVMLQVGSRVFFAQAHIPGSQYAGPGSQEPGIALLESAVKPLAKTKPIVLYCGCCPWSRCPNVGPAYRRMKELGFTRVKVMYSAGNFGDDWVNKGYATEHG